MNPKSIVRRESSLFRVGLLKVPAGIAGTCYIRIVCIVISPLRCIGTAQTVLVPPPGDVKLWIPPASMDPPTRKFYLKMVTTPYKGTY